MQRRDFFRTVALPAGLVATLPALRAGGPAGGQIEGVGVADLVDLFTKELRLCKVASGQIVLFNASPQYRHPEYISATLAAAKALGAEGFALTSLSGSSTDSKMLLEAFKTADLVVGEIPLYSNAHNEALATGNTRTLMVYEDPPTLRRLFPNDDVIKRTYAGARRLRDAEEIRVTDDAGSDFVMNKKGRPAANLVGVSDRPGRFDHWPGGMVTCAPLEDTAEGIYVIQPGDAIMGLRRFCESPVRMYLEKGRITKIEGGLDAELIRERLERYQDAKTPGKLSDPFRIAHAGWGTDHRCEWQNIGMDSENMYGDVTVSLGRNMVDLPDEFAGLGGANYTPVHLDICCRYKKLYLDGELIVDDNKIVVPELA